MAKQPKQSKITSITETAAHNHLTNAANWQSLGCTLIPGFYLQKITKGCSWRYRYIDRKGKRRVATIGKFPGMIPHTAALKARGWYEAGIDPHKEKARRKQSELAEDTQRDQRTLRKYLEGGYRLIMDSWPDNSRRMAEARFHNHFDELMERPMDEITHADLRKWEASCKKRKLTQSTITRTYSALKTLLRRAVIDNVIQADPLATFKLYGPTIEEQERADAAENEARQKERRMLTPDEIDKLHNGLNAFADELRAQRRNSRKHGKPHLPDLDQVRFPGWFIPFCQLGFHTGLRPGDLLSLTWTELNIHFYRLVKKPNKTKYKARRTGREQIEVDIPLNKIIAEIMRGWWDQSGKPDDGLVFPSPITGRELDSKAYQKPWKRVKKLGELSSNLDFYGLRHNFISALVTQGIPMFAVAKLAGHKSVAMIEQHYGHLCPQQAVDAVDVLARHARGTEGQRGDVVGTQEGNR